MDSKEILRAVDVQYPELMAKTAQMVAILNRIEPDFVPDVVKDFDTILDVVKEKTADKTTGLKSFAIGVGGTVAGGLLGSIATDLYDAAKRGLSKGRNFSRIMEANPSLKREVDKKNLHMAYNALHRFAPDFTADPLIGGALLKQIAELPQMSHKTIIELIGARKDIQDAKGRHFSEMSKLTPLLIPEGKQIEERKGIDPSSYTKTVKRPARPGE